jgi:hypothetical protein
VIRHTAGNKLHEPRPIKADDGQNKVYEHDGIYIRPTPP